jgi:hypothetical protein
MVEIGLPIERGCSVRIEGFCRPFAFRGACRSRARFRHPALVAPIGAIHFSARNHCAYGTYGIYGVEGRSIDQIDLPIKRGRRVRM